jgi:hypothetical protein
VRLAEAVGVSQPTAWRMGHALRLKVARENPLGGTVEIDEFYIGGQPKKKIDGPPPGRGRKGWRKTMRISAAEGRIITNIAPKPFGDRLHFGQHRHRRIVGVNAFPAAPVASIPTDLRRSGPPQRQIPARAEVRGEGTGVCHASLSPDVIR